MRRVLGSRGTFVRAASRKLPGAETGGDDDRTLENNGRETESPTSLTATGVAELYPRCHSYCFTTSIHACSQRSNSIWLRVQVAHATALHLCAGNGAGPFTGVYIRKRYIRVVRLTIVEAVRGSRAGDALLRATMRGAWDPVHYFF